MGRKLISAVPPILPELRPLLPRCNGRAPPAPRRQLRKWKGLRLCRFPPSIGSLKKTGQTAAFIFADFLIVYPIFSVLTRGYFHSPVLFCNILIKYKQKINLNSNILTLSLISISFELIYLWVKWSISESGPT